MAALACTRTLALAAALSFVGCASGPDLPREVTIEPGRPTRVVLQQLRGGQTFLLQNASSTEAADFYDGDMPAMAKIAPDAQLQALLDILAQKGLFARGAGAVPPDARDVLAVEHDGRRWTWARRQAGVQQDEVAFHEARTYFLELYNQSLAYHPGTSMDAAGWQQEQERLRREAAAARRKLEGLQRDPAQPTPQRPEARQGDRR